MTDYGPNTPHVEALLAQVRDMTPEKARVANGAWVTGPHHRVEVRAACWRSLAKDRPARIRVLQLNPAVVADAVDALVARDLITPDGPWNQAAYDLLTGPLRKAGITVHPDDPALED